jgi:hypothetical protein
MKYWMIAYLFDVSGQLQAKDIYEAEGIEQCEKFAEDYARVHINTQMMMQLHCISDDEYRIEIGDDK